MAGWHSIGSPPGESICWRIDDFRALLVGRLASCPAVAVSKAARWSIPPFVAKCRKGSKGRFSPWALPTSALTGGRFRPFTLLATCRDAWRADGAVSRGDFFHLAGEGGRSFGRASRKVGGLHDEMKRHDVLKLLSAHVPQAKIAAVTGVPLRTVR